MRTFSLRLLFASLLLAATTAMAADRPVRVVLAGDSTVTDSAGWGAAFAKLLGPDAVCINLAVGGQSSKSFRDSRRWQKVLDARPDFVLIQFGHNDMPGKGPERETDPETTYRDNLIRCVDEARAIGAQPILVTSLTRRLFDDGKIRGELKPWADSARKVATEKEVPLVDLFARSVTLHNELGAEESDKFNPPGRNGQIDHTHLNAHGAEVIAGIIAEELRKVTSDLARQLR